MPANLATFPSWRPPWALRHGPGARHLCGGLALLSLALPAWGAPEPGAARPIFIQEYRVQGAHQLSADEIAEAVYPFVGPARTEADVEQARAALEKAYQDMGFQAVAVEVPPQQGRRGIIFLQVTENKVGRLRVHGSRYFSLAQIKKNAPSLAEGSVPNFNKITHDIVALNQLPDRRITPSLRAGVEPGTVDVDLEVQDTLPLHGSLELNNRYSPDTSELRLNGSISYNNLWQQGHSAGLSFQIAPENSDDAKVVSAYYIARFQQASWLSLMLQGTRQDSNVSTLGGAAVAGRGEIVGLRGIISLPPGKEFYHSVSLGLDSKHFDQDVNLGPTLGLSSSPVTYYPLSALYNATWAPRGSQTSLSGGVTFALRQDGQNQAEFETSRSQADSGFSYFRGELSHTHDLPAGLQIFAKVQGQIAGQALVSSEQITGGGLDTVRGYLEGEVPGDNAIFGTLEWRSPSLAGWLGDQDGEWRVYAFFDGGRVTVNDPLPQQEDAFALASYGFGSRLGLLDHLNGSIDAGFPLTDQSHTHTHDLLLTFRLWAAF